MEIPNSVPNAQDISEPDQKPSAEATPNREASTRLQMLEKFYSEHRPNEVIGMIMAIGGEVKNYDTSSQPDQAREALGNPMVYQGSGGRRMIGLGLGASVGLLPRFGLEEIALSLKNTVRIPGDTQMGSEPIILVPYPRLDEDGKPTNKSRVLMLSEEQVKALDELVDKNKE